MGFIKVGEIYFFLISFQSVETAVAVSPIVQQREQGYPSQQLS